MNGTPTANSTKTQVVSRKTNELTGTAKTITRLQLNQQA